MYILFQPQNSLFELKSFFLAPKRFFDLNSFLLDRVCFLWKFKCEEWLTTCTFVQRFYFVWSVVSNSGPWIQHYDKSIWTGPSSGPDLGQTCTLICRDWLRSKIVPLQEPACLTTRCLFVIKVKVQQMIYIYICTRARIYRAWRKEKPSWRNPSTGMVPRHPRPKHYSENVVGNGRQLALSERNTGCILGTLVSERDAAES